MTTLYRASALIVATLCMFAACGGDDTSTSDTTTTLASLSATGGVAGQQGKLRVTLLSPATSDVTVALASSDEGVVAVESEVTLPEGALAIDVPFDAIATGTATVTAELGEGVKTASVAVASTLELGGFSATATLQVGATSLATVSLNIATAEPLEVELLSSDPAVLEVPARAQFAAFDSAVVVPFRARASGVATVTARYGGRERALLTTVVDDVSLVGYFGGGRYQVGAVAALTISLNAAVAADTTVNLMSTTPSVVEVPASVTIRAGTASASLTLPVIGEGGTELLAALGGLTRSVRVDATATVVLDGLSLSSRLEPGGSTTLSVFLDALPAGPQEITLSVSDPTILEVPPSIVMTSSSTSFGVRALARGVVTVQATLGASSRSATVTVADASLSSLSVPSTALLGPTLLSASFDTTVLSTRTVTLTSSNPAVFSVPASVQVVAGDLNTTFAGTAAAPGTAIVTATSGTATVSSQISVVTMPTFSSFFTSGALSVGLSANAFLNVSPATQEPVTFTLRSTTPSVVTFPASVEVLAGRTSVVFPYTAIGEGTTELIATGLGRERFVSINVVATPTLFVSASGTLRVGHAFSVSASLNAPAASPVVVTLSASPAGILTLPASLTIPAGSSSENTVVIGEAAGTTTITATWNGQTVTRSVTVAP